MLLFSPFFLKKKKENTGILEDSSSKKDTIACALINVHCSICMHEIDTVEGCITACQK